MNQSDQLSPKRHDDSNRDCLYGYPACPCTCKDPNAVSLGTKGGKATTEAKQRAARKNGKKGGRPKTR